MLNFLKKVKLANWKKMLMFTLLTSWMSVQVWLYNLVKHFDIVLFNLQNRMVLYKFKGVKSVL